MNVSSGRIFGFRSFNCKAQRLSFINSSYNRISLLFCSKCDGPLTEITLEGLKITRKCGGESASSKAETHLQRSDEPNESHLPVLQAQCCRGPRNWRSTAWRRMQRDRAGVNASATTRMNVDWPFAYQFQLHGFDRRRPNVRDIFLRRRLDANIYHCTGMKDMDCD